MKAESPPDRELLAGLTGQPELMAVLYERHSRSVFRYLARRAGSAAAEDLVSEVFVAALSAADRVTPHDSGSALPWLYGIALNVLRAHFRKQPAAGCVAADLGVDWDAVDDRIDALARRGQLRAALDGLSGTDRELLLLVAWEELTPAQAAAVLGISPVAARSRLHRARQRAGKALRGAGVAPASTPAAARTTELFAAFHPQEKTS